MVRRETQTPTYWHNYQVSEADLEHITNLLIEKEQPRSIEELAQDIIAFRCQREEQIIKRELARGELYQPRHHYEVGQTLVFPALDYAVGEVVHVRPGNNPEYGSFQVARVRFENQQEREFAIDLQAPHRLNYDGDLVEEDGLLSPEELYELHGAPVREALTQYLERSDDFVRLAGRWFLKSLLVPINIGHLNLAEAVLDMADGGPLPTQVFLKDLDLPPEINQDLRIFSLNYALSQDKRFDEVGPAGQILWFLRAREPKPVLDPPRRLKPVQIPYDANALDPSLLLLERDLEDEWSEAANAPVGPVNEATLVLTFPHWCEGTLPLTARLKHIFPMGRTHRIRFLFQDAESGETWPGWVVHRQRYVFGLDRWYRDNRILSGAFITVRKGDEPGVVQVDLGRRRPTREWVRVAVPREGQINFEMRKQLVGCTYDELMVVAVDDQEGIDQIWRHGESEQTSVKQLLYHIFPELAKLNPQGTVHAKTLYAAVNVVRRLPPGPIFAVLMQDMAFLPVGDNYWLFTQDSAL